MPLQLTDRDVVSELTEVSSALIVPCNLCPAVTVAVRQERPFLQLFRNPLKSAPFEEHITSLQSRLREHGVTTEVFTSRLWHHWFLCMWTSGRRKKLARCASNHDAVIVLGCDSATETVREAVQSTGCKVIQAMEVAGFMNARPKLHWPCNVSFEGCKLVPVAHNKSDEL